MYQFTIEGNFEQIRQAVHIINKEFRRIYNVYGAKESYKKTYAILQLNASWSMYYGCTYADVYLRIVNKLNRLGYTCNHGIIWVEE